MTEFKTLKHLISVFNFNYKLFKNKILIKKIVNDERE